MNEENYGFENGNYDPYRNGSPSGKGQGTGLGIASMVCGIVSILSICCGSMMSSSLVYACVILGIVAIVLGIVQIVKNESKGMAIAGIVCGAVGIVMFIAILALGLYVINTLIGWENLDDFMMNPEKYLKDITGWYYIR